MTNAVCCAERRIVPASPNLVVARFESGEIITRAVRQICLGCGTARTASGSSTVVTTTELDLRRSRVAQCDEAAAAICDARLCDPSRPEGFPDPFWVASTDLVQRVSAAAITPLHSFRAGGSDVVELSPMKTALVGEIRTAIGNVQIGSLYFDHLIEKNEDGGLTRFDEDHFSYTALVRSTLTAPLEIYRAKVSGQRFKFVFLSFYLVDAAWTYHAAIVTRDFKLLTAYRLGGGRAKFLAARNGRLIYARYDKLCKLDD